MARKPLYFPIVPQGYEDGSTHQPRHDEKLRNKVEKYLDEKCAKRVFETDNHPLRFALRGVKLAMWKRVVKPELNRMAEERNHHLSMLVENVKMDWLEFEFIELPAEMPQEVRRQEPPLEDSELRAIRELLKKEKVNG